MISCSVRVLPVSLAGALPTMTRCIECVGVMDCLLGGQVWMPPGSTLVKKWDGRKGAESKAAGWHTVHFVPTRCSLRSGLGKTLLTAGSRWITCRWTDLQCAVDDATGLTEGCMGRAAATVHYRLPSSTVFLRNGDWNRAWGSGSSFPSLRVRLGRNNIAASTGGLAVLHRLRLPPSSVQVQAQGH